MAGIREVLSTFHPIEYSTSIHQELTFHPIPLSKIPRQRIPNQTLTQHSPSRPPTHPNKTRHTLLNRAASAYACVFLKDGPTQCCCRRERMESYCSRRAEDHALENRLHNPILFPSETHEIQLIMPLTPSLPSTRNSFPIIAYVFYSC
jgi:hypothetical protein